MNFAHFSILLAGVLLVIACNKDEDQLSPADQFALDIKIIEDYLSEKGLTAQKTASGLHYFITEEGPGDHPAPGDTVTVKYKGYLTDGRIFDQTAPANVLTLPLDQFIPGWVEGIPYLRSGGGKGTLLLPSILGYGPFEVGSIPANSVLIFDVTLVDFK